MSKAPEAFWTEPSPATYDFRSDTVTTPTAAQSRSLPGAPIYDAILSPAPLNLSTPITRAINKPASLFITSGTLSNLLALRALITTPPPYTILCDSRSHIYRYEAGNVATVWGVQLTPITPAGHHLTLDDVKRAWVTADYDIHFAPTVVVALENTLCSGRVHPLESINEIAAFVHEKGGKVHMDGARLWHAAEATKTPIAKIVENVDSLSVCCSKGLGAPVGGHLFGDLDTVERARKLRKMLGGAIRQEGVLTAMCDAAYVEVVEGGKLAKVHEAARRVGDLWTALGGHLTEEVETNMVFVKLEDERMEEVWEQVAERMGITVSGSRLVIHHQNYEAGVERLELFLAEVWKTWTGHC